MTTKWKSRELARAFEHVIVRANELEPETILAELDEIEAKFLPLAGKSELLRLETRRRVAEWKFKLLCERNLPPERVKKLHQAIRKLGFTDFDREVTVDIYFTQYWIRQSRSQDATRILKALLKKLNAYSRYVDATKRSVARHLRSLEE